MSKRKVSVEDKIYAVNLYLDGKESQHRIASMFDVCTASVQQWIRNYESMGADDYPITDLCRLGRVSRAAYYKWLHREIPENEQQNRRIADEIEKIHAESPDKGYRRIRDDLERYHDIDVNTILQKKFHTLLKV